ncbi:MAG TPA: hypothetical protein HA346_00865, partial [Thermoplasmata archaeon]|nr:hypothetical protein [Thermoplasmata archaeon]
MSRGAHKSSNGFLREERSDLCRMGRGMSLKGEHNRDFAAHGISHFPSDWPGPGPVDRMIHDLPHLPLRSPALEWWYVDGHLKTDDGEELSLFASFFRMAWGLNKVTGEIEYYHAVTWALSDVNGKVCHTDSLVDKRAPEVGLEWIRQGRGARDPCLNRAIAEVLKKGHIPTPDHVFEGSVHIGEKSLKLNYGSAQFEGLGDGSYHLHLFNSRENTGCDLMFYPEKQPVRHGKDGIVRGTHEKEEMFYYFISRLRLTGTVTLNGREQPVSGSGWYDREFGGQYGTEIKSLSETAWNWTGIHLDDGSDLTAYSFFRRETGEPLEEYLILVGPEGRRIFSPSFKFEPVRWWRSTRTFLD